VHQVVDFIHEAAAKNKEHAYGEHNYREWPEEATKEIKKIFSIWGPTTVIGFVSLREKKISHPRDYQMNDKSRDGK
jgi:hypothetical protein